MPDRTCINEGHIVHHAGGMTQDVWVFYYSDDTVETVTGKWKHANACRPTQYAARLVLV